MNDLAQRLTLARRRVAMATPGQARFIALFSLIQVELAIQQSEISPAVPCDRPADWGGGPPAAMAGVSLLPPLFPGGVDLR